MNARRELRCRRCGYGIVAIDPPASGCPMCHTAGWAATGNRTMQDDHRARPTPSLAYEVQRLVIQTAAVRDLERVP
jgi:hypothetical protein